MTEIFKEIKIQSSTGLGQQRKKIDNQVFGAKVGIFAKLFGCVHNNISRPFTSGKTSYRTCLGCGARKQFDSETLKTFGSFYYPPIVRSEI